MNRMKNNLLPAMVSLGAILLSLRLRLYTVAVDEKKLILSGHPLSLVIWAVTAVCLVLALAAAFRKTAGAEPARTPLAAFGDGVFALILAITAVAMGTPVTLVEKVRLAMAVVCVAALVFSAFCRAKGKPVFFGCFALVCVFFALYLVSSYQLWSSNPQLQDYVFSMLACVAVTLFAYQSAALSVGNGNGKIFLASGLLAVCFGIAAVQCAEHMLLYVGIAQWALTGLANKEN